MIVKSQKDIDKLLRIGRIVALTIKEMKIATKAGITTEALDEIGNAILTQHGAVSAPKKYVQFPKYTCISINQEAAHGIPGPRKIKAGDLVNIDVSAELDGYFADAGHSFQVPPYNKKLVRLCDYTYKTMMKIISELTAGVRLHHIGKMLEYEAKKGGYQVVLNLCSHGIGKALHEAPHEILPYYDPDENEILQDGHVITIEPFLSTGASFVDLQGDGWTLKVPDQSFVAQHEHTLIITKGKPIIVTEVE